MSLLPDDHNLCATAIRVEWRTKVRFANLGLRQIPETVASTLHLCNRHAFYFYDLDLWTTLKVETILRYKVDDYRIPEVLQ